MCVTPYENRVATRIEKIHVELAMSSLGISESPLALTRSRFQSDGARTISGRSRVDWGVSRGRDNIDIGGLVATRRVGFPRSPSASRSRRPSIFGAGRGAQAQSLLPDIAPILQRASNCHRPNSVAPMPLLTYEQVRPYASAIKRRTSIRSRQGTMPPWYIEKGIGIQQYKNDVSLSDEEVAKIASWADNGAPRGNPADLPPARTFDDSNGRVDDRDAGSRGQDAPCRCQSRRALTGGGQPASPIPASPRIATSRR